MIDQIVELIKQEASNRPRAKQDYVAALYEVLKDIDMEIVKVMVEERMKERQ